MKKICYLLIAVLLALPAYNKSFSDEQRVLRTVPALTTTDISAVTQTTAQSGGVITSSGNDSITARGVCWSTNHNPTTADSKIENGTGSGLFVSTLTGLIAGTIYYVRAYAGNGIGTAYGNELSFTTLSTTLPAIITGGVSIESKTTATAGGIISSDGGTPITSRGICWSTRINPTTSDSKTIEGAGTGPFVSLLTGLILNTTYYVRSYATNSIGTAYGEEVQYTPTLPPPNAITDFDGHVYTVIQLGTQFWLKENLKTTHYLNVDPIATGLSDAEWSQATAGAFAVYNNDTVSINNYTYGKLYNGYAVADPRKIAPPGFHIATDAEWNVLLNFYGGWYAAAHKLQNALGFAAVLNGYRSSNGRFYNIESLATWWVADTTHGRVLYAAENEMGYIDSKALSRAGLAVRCVKD